MVRTGALGSRLRFVQGLRASSRVGGLSGSPRPGNPVTNLTLPGLRGRDGPGSPVAPTRPNWDNQSRQPKKEPQGRRVPLTRRGYFNDLFQRNALVWLNPSLLTLCGHFQALELPGLRSCCFAVCYLIADLSQVFHCCQTNPKHPTLIFTCRINWPFRSPQLHSFNSKDATL